MIQKTIVIALIDKAWPPEHSFVDGMLAGELALQPGLTVRLIVSRSSRVYSLPCRYINASCIPRLHSRRKMGRLFNLWVALRLIAYQSRREKSRGHRVVVFVRNDPVLLLASSLLRFSFERLVFQSSFPHELFSGHCIKRNVAKLLYKIAGRGVDIISGVSPESVKRIKNLCPSAKFGEYIPLLSDLPLNYNKRVFNYKTGPIFVYVGTHNIERELEVVVNAIVLATKLGNIALYRFVGATKDDELRLRSVEGVEQLVRQGVIFFERPVPRNMIPKILAECDVGLSLIPPKPVYYESSPTKLAEYMSSGLVVLASRGIPMQEKFVASAKCGILVDWSVETISDGILELTKNPNSLHKFSHASIEYAEKYLKYANYLPVAMRWVR